MTVVIHKPNVSNVFCDKLSVTLKIDPEYHSEVLSKITDLIDNWYASVVHTPQYKFSIRLVIGNNDESTLIQCSPHLDSISFFRVECNPSRLGSEGLSELKLRLDDILPDGYDGLMQYGICTRFDATIDIHDVQIDKLCFRYPSMQLSKAFYRKGGINNYTHDIESYYLGGDSGKRQFCVYDKAQQIKAHNAKYPLVKKAIPNHPITRIEVKNRERLPMMSLTAIPNQFEKLGVYSFHKLPNSDWKFNLFVKAVRSEGMQNALLGLPEDVRKKYLKWSELAKPTYWKPDEHWKYWPCVVEEIIHPAVSCLALPVTLVSNA